MVEEERSEREATNSIRDQRTNDSSVLKNRPHSFSASLSFLSGCSGRSESVHRVNHRVSTAVLSPTDDFLPDHR